MSDRSWDALESVRRLIRTGNNKTYWRKREQELLAQRSKPNPNHTPGSNPYDR